MRIDPGGHEPWLMGAQELYSPRALQPKSPPADWLYTSSRKRQTPLGKPTQNGFWVWGSRCVFFFTFVSSASEALQMPSKHKRCSTHVPALFRKATFRKRLFEKQLSKNDFSKNDFPKTTFEKRFSEKRISKNDIPKNDFPKSDPRKKNFPKTIFRKRFSSVSRFVRFPFCPFSVLSVFRFVRFPFCPFSVFRFRQSSAFSVRLSKKLLPEKLFSEKRFSESDFPKNDFSCRPFSVLSVFRFLLFVSGTSIIFYSGPV